MSAQTGWEVRLPTEVEWEAAARGPAGRAYPWGEDYVPLRANVDATRLRRPAPVGVLPEGDSAAGVSDPAGNIYEWTSSLFGAGDFASEVPEYTYPYRAGDGREDAEAPTSIRRVVRGGSCAGNPADVRTVYRDHELPDNRTSLNGFRMVVLRAEAPGS